MVKDILQNEIKIRIKKRTVFDQFFATRSTFVRFF